MATEILLRDVQASDLPIFFDHQLDPEAVRLAAFPSRDYDAFMSHWKRILLECAGFLKTIIFRGEVAGNIVCWEHSGEWNVGYWLGKEYWGKGIATAALSQFLQFVKMRPLFAHVAKSNAPSIRVLQKCGFTIAGEDKFPFSNGEESEEFILRLNADATFSKEIAMTFTESVLPEFDQEMAKTRKVLERIPEDKLDWQPHPKSHTIGWNANHLADLPGWGLAILTQPQFDFAPVGGQRYETPKLRTRKEILDLFDRNISTMRKAIADIKDDDVNKTWTLLAGGNPIFSLPRSVVVRNFVLNHMIHHRAILCVYLRLNDIPVPGMFGPSGDE